MYITNNIVEFIYSRINYYLPKHKYNKHNFIKCIENIIYHDSIKNNDVIRHDYKTKGLLVIIEKEKINKDPKWINYETFQTYFDKIKKIIRLHSNTSIKELVNNYDKEIYNNIEGIENIIIIGLVNLGCTCYLNTVIQLLFHIIEFRNVIINLDINNENENALYSLKKLFIDMIMYHKDRKYIKQNFFINNYDNQIIDIYNQKDAFEFLFDLFDKIEKHLLSTNIKNLIKYFFQGKYNIITIKSINGDNKIFCEKCKKKRCLSRNYF